MAKPFQPEEASAPPQAGPKPPGEPGKLRAIDPTAPNEEVAAFLRECREYLSHPWPREDAATAETAPAEKSAANTSAAQKTSGDAEPAAAGAQRGAPGRSSPLQNLSGLLATLQSAATSLPLDPAGRENPHGPPLAVSPARESSPLLASWEESIPGKIWLALREKIEPQTTHWHLLWQTALLTTFLLLALGLSFNYFSQRALENAILQGNHNYARAVATGVNLYVKSIVQLLEETANSLAVTNPGPWEEQLLLRNLMVSQRCFNYLVLTDKNGKPLAMTSERVVGEYRPFVATIPRYIAKGEKYISNVYMGDATPSIWVAVPLKQGTEVLGMLAADVDLRNTWDLLKEMKLSQRGLVALVAKQGMLISHPDTAEVLRRTDLKHSKAVAMARRREAGNVHIQSKEMGRFLATSVPIKGLNWSVLVQQPVPASPLLPILIPTLFICLLCAWGLSNWFIKRSLTPLELLGEGLRKIKAGNFGYAIPTSARGELADLVKNFNFLSRRLQESQKQIRELEKQNQARLEEAASAKRGLEKITAELRTSQELAQVLCLEEDREVVFPKILEILCASLDFPGAVLALDLPHAGRVEARFPALKTPKSPSAGEKRLFELLAKARIPLLFPAPGQPYQEELATLCGRARMSAVALFPIFLRQEYLGGIAFYSRARGAALPAEKLQVVETLTHHLALAAEAAGLSRQLEDSFYQTLRGLLATLEARDPYTYSHSRRVALYAQDIALEMRVPYPVFREIYLAAPLHDIGKIGIRDNILYKPTQLTDEELATIRQHPAIGRRMLENFENMDIIIPVVSGHHEFFNGGGYPLGISREELSLATRIVSVADTFDAMTTTRPYRQAMDPLQVLDEIANQAGNQFDPEVVAAFFETPTIRLVREAGLPALIKSLPPSARNLALPADKPGDTGAKAAGSAEVAATTESDQMESKAVEAAATRTQGG